MIAAGDGDASCRCRSVRELGDVRRIALVHVARCTRSRDSPRVIASIAETPRLHASDVDPAPIATLRLARRTEIALGHLLGFPHVVLQRSEPRTMAAPAAPGRRWRSRARRRRGGSSNRGSRRGTSGGRDAGFASLDPEGMLGTLESVRRSHPQAGVLIVTQSFFPIESQSPNLGLLRALGNHFDATLVVDTSHDLGCHGPNGTGFLGAQDVLGFIDVVTAISDERSGATRASSPRARVRSTSDSPTALAPAFLRFEPRSSSPPSSSRHHPSVRCCGRGSCRSRRAAPGARRPRLLRVRFRESGRPVLVGDADSAVLVQQYLEGEGIAVELATPRPARQRARRVPHRGAPSSDARPDRYRSSRNRVCRGAFRTNRLTNGPL